MNNLNNNNCEQKLITEHYEQYTREYQNAVINLEKFNSRTKDLIIETYRSGTENSNRNHHAATLNKLCSHIKILQELNQYIASTDQAQSLTVTSSTFESPVNNCIFESPAEIVEPSLIKELPLPIMVEVNQTQNQAKIKQNSLIDIEHPSKHFNYPQPEIHLYTKDHKGVCLISYVRKCDYKSFFIVDNSMVKSSYKEALSKLANLSFELKVNPNWIPDVDDVFGVFIDNGLFRAVKQTKAEANDRTFKIFLIDIGEIFDVDIGKKDLYDLPKDVRIMPTQALYCILDRKSKVTMDYLRSSLYKERTFRIARIKKYTFHLDDIKEITNPFYTELVAKQINDSKEYQAANPNKTMYIPAECTSSSDEFTLSGSEISSRTSKVTVLNRNEIAPQPIFLETKSTSSAIEAVMTFRPTDDNRICHFYNSRTGSCFKGPNCQLQHLPQVEGGWSRDKVETITKIAAEIEYPDNNSLITIIPTSIEINGSFWGQIEFGRRTDSFTKLKLLNLQLNSAEFVGNFKPLDHFPVYSELVLAQFRDNLWYRARIIGDYDQRFKVFFLDYGNCDFVCLEKLRKWDNRCDYLPFQAVLCRIANVSIKQDDHKRKVDVLKKLILNKRLTAIVLNNLSDLEVILMDEEGKDVGDILVEQNLAIHRKMITPKYGVNCNPPPQ